MKKLIVISLLLISSISYGQTAQEFKIRGDLKRSVKLHYEAIANYTKAININPSYA